MVEDGKVAFVYYSVNSSPVNTKHLYNIWTKLDQRWKRWADFVQMLHKCFVFAGLAIHTQFGNHYYLVSW